MSAALITPAMKAVLSDLGRWHLLGVDIAVVQATPEDGVKVGIAGDPSSATVEDSPAAQPLTRLDPGSRGSRHTGRSKPSYRVTVPWDTGR